MGYVIVLLLAALAGSLVYWASMRYAGGAGASDDDAAASTGTANGDEWREGEPSNGTDAEGLSAPGTGTAYIPVVPTRGSWQSRLGGVMGLVIAIVLAAATTAFVLYQAGHLITKLLTDAANSG